jgi:hypothetical protein
MEGAERDKTIQWELFPKFVDTFGRPMVALPQGNQSRSQHEIFESLFRDAIAPFESRREIVATGLEGFTWEQREA